MYTWLQGVPVNTKNASVFIFYHQIFRNPKWYGQKLKQVICLMVMNKCGVAVALGRLMQVDSLQENIRK